MNKESITKKLQFKMEDYYRQADTYSTKEKYYRKQVQKISPKISPSPFDTFVIEMSKEIHIHMALRK